MVQPANALQEVGAGCGWGLTGSTKRWACATCHVNFIPRLPRDPRPYRLHDASAEPLPSCWHRPMERVPDGTHCVGREPREMDTRPAGLRVKCHLEGERVPRMLTRAKKNVYIYICVRIYVYVYVCICVSHHAYACMRAYTSISIHT